MKIGVNTILVLTRDELDAMYNTLNSEGSIHIESETGDIAKLTIVLDEVVQ